MLIPDSAKRTRLQGSHLSPFVFLLAASTLMLGAWGLLAATAPAARGGTALALAAAVGILWQVHRRVEAAFRVSVADQRRAARLAEALSTVAAAASAREDPVSVLQLLARQAADALDLAEAQIHLAPTPHFPAGLLITNFSGDARSLEEGKDAPAHLLAAVLAGKRPPAAPKPDAAASPWFAFAITDLHGALGVLAVRVSGSAGDLSADACVLLSRLAGQAGLLLENSALFGDLVRRAAEVAGIAEIAGATLDELDLPGLLTLVVQRAAAITRATSTMISLADEQRRQWRIEACYGEYQEQLRGFSAPLDAGLQGYVIRTGEHLIVALPDAPVEIVPLIGGDTLHSAVLVPLRKNGVTIGCIAAFNRAGGALFTAKDARVLEILADQAAIAIENTRLYQRTIEEVEISNALLSIAHLVATEPEVENMLRMLHEATVQILGHGVAGTFLYDGTSFTGALPPLPGEAAGEDAPARLPDDDRKLADALLAHKDPLLIENPAADPLIPPELAARFVGGPLLICPLASRQGDLLGILVVGGRSFLPRDVAITLGIARLAALAVSHARLRQHMQHAERMQALGEMAAGIAHDFNNLLAGIMGNAQLGLLDNTGEEGARAALQTISRACLDGAGMIQRLQAGTNPSAAAPAEITDLAELARDALQLTHPRWKDQAQFPGSSLRVTSELEPDVRIHGRAAELREAIINLITNAIDAMPQGGTLSLRCRAQEPWAILEVADTGVGMDENVRRRVFDPFFTTKAERGHGFGLMLTYGIIHRHDGTVTVESAVNQGTTFTVRLPLPARKAPPAPLPPPIALPSLRILLADDEEMVAESLAELLRHAGHTVDTAPDGVQALQRWQENSYDLVITDYGMPELSGAELARRIKERAPRTPILLITGWDIPPQERELFLQATDAVLPKPVGCDELLRTLARILPREEPPLPANTPCRVLVVEDQPTIAKVLQAVLADSGYTVECANNAEQALAQFEREKHHLLITDLRLDGMEGTELARAVKQRAPATPVILLTGWRPDPAELQAVDYYLAKPFNVAELLKVVEQALAR